MQVRSPRKESIVSVSCIVRLGFILWGVCLTLTVWFLVSHSKIATEVITPVTVNNENSFSRSNPSPRRNTLQEEEETQEQKALRQKAARENQAWILGKWKLAGAVSTLGGQLQSPQQEEQSENSVKKHELPSWFGDQSNKMAISNEDLQYIDPMCQSFNHSILRPKHGCQVNVDSRLVYCNFQNLRIDVSKIGMDRGGEPLKDVMGREEFREFPIYEKGAFSVDKKPKFEVPNEYRVGLHYLENVLKNMRYPRKKRNQDKIETSCVETWSGTTLFITRYEYVNLYHTLTDWWNAYFVMPPNNHNVRVVFLDAHAQGNLDSVWETVFGKFTYVKHLPNGGVCFEHAVFIPPGYLATIYPETNWPRLRCPLRKKADEFSEHVLRSYGLDSVKPTRGKIVIIERVPYVAHPRSKPQSLQRVITNLDELKRKLLRVKKVTSVEMVQFETMSFKEQLKAIREAHILIGNHGAGLSHLIFMDRKSHVLEFTDAFLNFFIFLSEWKGVELQSIPVVEGSHLDQSDFERTIVTVETILDELLN